jgi:hypothetical protein
MPIQMAINFFYHCSAYYTSLVCLPRIEGNFGWWKEDRKEKKKGRPVVKWGGDALQMGPSKLQQLLAPVQLVKSHPTSKLSLDNWFKSVSLFKISSNRVRLKYRSDGRGLCQEPLETWGPNHLKWMRGEWEESRAAHESKQSRVGRRDWIEECL